MITLTLMSSIMGSWQALAQTAAPTGSTAPTNTSTTNTSVAATQTPETAAKKLTLKQKIAERRRLMREKLKQKRLARKKTQQQAKAPAPPTVSVASGLGFDEFQIPELVNDDYETDLIPSTSSAPSASAIPANFFEGIELKEPIPTTLYLDEIFSINGNANAAANGSTLFAFLNFTTNAGSEQFRNFETKTTGTSFSLPMFLKQTGSYLLGMVVGNSGKSKIRELQVKEMPQQPETVATSQKNNITLEYDSQTDKTYVKFHRTDDAFYRITLAQNEQKVSYITRQDTSSLPVRFFDFRKFKPGNVAVSLSTRSKNLTDGWQTIATTTIPITYHGFRTIENENVTLISPIPAVINSLAPIVIQGTAKQNFENETQITNSEGLVEKVTIKTSKPLLQKGAKSLISKESDFEFNYTPHAPGRYILEINNEEGSAVINVPVYVQAGVPLIPDYQDINGELKIKKHAASLETDRNQMLKLINIIREGYGKSPVMLDTKINALAQAHARDMVDRDFFGHVNPDGLSPHDRRKKAQIGTEIGENLAYSESVLAGMQGLLRSPIHRANILMDEWESVGIGIATDENGYLKMAQEFSSAPLTNTKLRQLETETLAAMNSARQNLSVLPLSSDSTLAQVAASWSGLLAATDEFGLTTKSGDSLSQKIEDAGMRSGAQLFVFSSNSSKDITSRILEPSSSLEAKWQKIGLGMAATSLGEIKITVILTK